MSDEPEQTIGEASRGAEEQHVEEAEEPEAPDWDEEDERSPWAE